MINKLSNRIFKSLYLSNRFKSEIFVCDETKNPTGSHKDRSFSVWLKKIKSEQKCATGLVISSSGNAAASAAYFAQKHRLPLVIFLARNVAPDKLAKIQNVIQRTGLIKIRLVKQPKFEAHKYAKENHFILLRASLSDDALLGYETLAREIEKTKINFGSFFIPSSSGTLAVGLARYLKKIKPQFHLVQTARVNALVKNFDQDYELENHSLADGIVDLIGHRRPEVEKIIMDSGGFGWTISDREIKLAQLDLKKAGIVCSPTSALSLAGLRKAIKSGFEIRKLVLLIIT